MWEFVLPTGHHVLAVGAPVALGRGFQWRARVWELTV